VGANDFELLDDPGGAPVKLKLRSAFG
jgi:hypothetical protein